MDQTGVEVLVEREVLRADDRDPEALNRLGREVPGVERHDHLAAAASMFRNETHFPESGGKMTS